MLITGPARGIGEETARALAARGARLSLVGLEPERLAALAAELGDGHVWFECDVTEQAALERAAEGTVEALGGIDVVIANAGIASNRTVAVGPVDALVRTIEVNLVGVVRTVCATLPHVTERAATTCSSLRRRRWHRCRVFRLTPRRRAASSSSATCCGLSWRTKA